MIQSVDLAVAHDVASTQPAAVVTEPVVVVTPAAVVVVVVVAVVAAEVVVVVAELGQAGCLHVIGHMAALTVDK